MFEQNVNRIFQVSDYQVSFSNTTFLTFNCKKRFLVYFTLHFYALTNNFNFQVKNYSIHILPYFENMSMNIIPKSRWNHRMPPGPHRFLNLPSVLMIPSQSPGVLRVWLGIALGAVVYLLEKQ